MDETRVREALDQLAGDAPDAPALWDRTQRRITHRRHRRTGLGAVAIVAILAIGAGTVAAVTRDTSDNRITAGPSAPANPPGEVLGVVDGELVVMNALDVSQPRTIAVPHRTIAEVSTAPGAPWIVYTSADARTEGCPGGPALVKARPDGSQAETVVGGGITYPLVSPNGAWVAYSMSECETRAVIGVTNLETGENFQISDSGNIEGNNEYPLAWAPDSSRLLVATAFWGARIISVPLGDDAQPVSGIGPFASVATFTADGVIVFASTFSPQESPGDTVVQMELPDEARDLLALPGRRVRSISYDPASRTLLLAVVDIDSRNNPTGSGQLIRLDDTGVHYGPEVAGLESAVWHANASAASTTTTMPETTTTGPDLSAANIVVPDLRGLSIGAASAAVGTIGLVADVRQGSESVYWQEPPAGATRRAGQTVFLWACVPAADCVPGPPPDYIDAFEPATDWRPIVFADDFGSTLGSPATASPEELGALVAAVVGDGSEGSSVSHVVSCAGCPTHELWVQTRNVPDDSADGWDYRFFLSRTDAGWTIDRGEVRVICVRADVATDSCL